MRARPALAPVVAIACLLAGGCSGESEPPASDSAAPASARDAQAAAPSVRERVPRSPRRLARRLTEVTDGLARAIDDWRRAGDAGGPAPEDVTLHALYQQRAVRLLARRPRLARRALPLMPRRVRALAEDASVALRSLHALTPPQHRARRFRTLPPEPAGVLRRHYEAAQRRFGVHWHVLAAINLVETAFGRIRSSSYAGAQGPMQFIPATWRAYGMGGDVRDPRDAIMGAANYLHASGAPRDYARALYAYNRSRLYVRAVRRLSRRMARSPRAFYALYGWEVFVRTPSGDLRLTGPGAPARDR